MVGIEQPKKAVAVEPLRQSARLNLEKLQVRERNAVRAMEESIAKIGVGVSERAQTIFDALAKTLPCRWEGEAIVIMEEVRISPPYKLENIVGSSTASLQHVRKVLKHQGLV